MVPSFYNSYYIYLDVKIADAYEGVDYFAFGVFLIV